MRVLDLGCSPGRYGGFLWVLLGCSPRAYAVICSLRAAWALMCSWSMVASKEVGRGGFVLGLDLTHVPFGKRLASSADIPSLASLRELRARERDLQRQLQSEVNGEETKSSSSVSASESTRGAGGTRESSRSLLQKNFYFLQQDVFTWEPPAHLRHSFDVVLSDMVRARAPSMAGCVLVLGSSFTFFFLVGCCCSWIAGATDLRCQVL